MLIIRDSYKSMRGHTFIGDANFAEIAHAFGVKSESIADPKDVIPAPGEGYDPLSLRPETSMPSFKAGDS